MPSSATFTTVAHSDELHVLGETLRPLLTIAMGSSIEVFDTTGPADAGPPPHRHPWEEIYVVLEGELDVWIDGSGTRRVGPGSVVHVPASVGHGYRNVNDAHFLTIVTHGNASAFFAGAATIFSDDPSDFGRLVSLAERLGVENVA